MKKTYFLLIIILTVLGCKKEEERNTILGSWNCEEYSDIGQRNYQVSITRNYYLRDSTNEYIISNFHNLGINEFNDVYIKKIEINKLIITGTANLGISISGIGSVSDDFSRIEWEYTVNDGLTIPEVRANYY